MAALKRRSPALCVGRIDRHARRGARAPLLRGGELQRVAHGFSRAGSVHPQLAALQRQPLRQQRRQRGFFDIGQAERLRRRAAFLRRGRCARPRRRPEAEGDHGQPGQQAQRTQRQCNAPSIPFFHVQPPAQIAGRPRIPPPWSRISFAMREGAGKLRSPMETYIDPFPQKRGKGRKQPSISVILVYHALAPVSRFRVGAARKARKKWRKNPS